MTKFESGGWKKMQSWMRNKGGKKSVHLWIHELCSFNKTRLSESLISPAETLRSVKQPLHSDTSQEIIDDPLHGILRRHVGKSFSIFDLADETNAPGLLCQFSLLRVKQSGFPGPAMRRVREQPSWKCLLSSTKWCNVAFHLAPLCYLSLTEL